MLVLVSAGSTQAGSIQVAGKLGYLSEWEISAEVTPDARKKEFSGPLTIRHTGVCTPGRTTEMLGEIRYQITGWVKSRMKATLLIEGIECGFEATLAETYDGVISCPLWRGVPLSLSIKSTE
jgi:hypothetical protein